MHIWRKMHSRVVLICTDDTSDIFPLILLIEKKKKTKTKIPMIWIYRENGSSMDGAESLNTNKSSFKANGDLKRKQSEVVSETQYPNKSPKNVQGNQQSSPSNGKGSFKKPKG